MRLVFSTPEGEVYPLDVDATSAWNDVAAILEANTGIRAESQRYLLNGQPMIVVPGATVTSLGLKDDDMVVCVAAESLNSGAAGARSGAPASSGRGGKSKKRGVGHMSLPATAQIDPSVYESLTWETLPPNISPIDLWKILQVNRNMLKRLERSDPELLAAARATDGGNTLRTLLLQRNLQRALPEAERKAKLAGLERRLASNPYDVEAQKLLEEEIQRQNIEANYELAYEHMPESFASVHMLYIPATVNGVPIRAFVDSGAQSTIMSQGAAQRCGIMRLVDTKFSGTAIGVGKAKIIGRVHMAPLTIGPHHFPCTFTVMESDDMEFLFGLDMLKRYAACIDLKKNVLRLEVAGEAVEVPFLGEKDSKATWERSRSEEEGQAHGEGGAGAGEGGSSTAGATAGAGAGASASADVSMSGVGSKSAGSALSGVAHAGASAGAPPAVPTRGTVTGAGASSRPPGGVAPMFDFSGLGGSTRGAGSGVASTGSTSTLPSPDPASVAMLESMGFPRAKVLQALARTKGDVNRAAALLPDM